MFSIQFDDQPLEYPYDDTSVPAAPGSLHLGKWMEEFDLNLSVWSKSQYESHWMHELKELVTGRPKIALIVNFSDPKNSSNMEIWLVYRDGELVYIQNQIPWYSNLPRDFDVSKISESIDDRQETTSEGYRISEWLFRCGILKRFCTALVFIRTVRKGPPLTLAQTSKACGSGLRHRAKLLKV
jgi:hypothetical protein